MPWNLYLDESGDLGFDFANKNPSKFLTISILAVSSRQNSDAIRGAVKKTLKRKVNNGKKGKKRPEQELKGASTSIAVKRYFLDQIRDVHFGVYAMTLNKRRVYEDLCDTAKSKDRLYNFVAQQVIKDIPFERATDQVNLVVDRSKGKAGIADFDHYVLSQLQGRLRPEVRLQIRHADSCEDLCLSAADLFCWGIFRRRERADDEWLKLFKSKVRKDDQYL